MEVFGKIGIGLVAVSVFSSIIFVSTAADPNKPAQPATVINTANASQSMAERSPANGPLNSKDATQKPLKVPQYTQYK